MAYLDTAATAPVRPEALAAYVQAARVTGNPSSIHAAGRAARDILERARGQVAAACGADPAEVVFTGGGTEAINTAIKGAFWARRQVVTGTGPRTVVLAAGEHHASFEAARWLETQQGARLREVPLDARGRVTPERLRAVLAADIGPDAVVISFSAANNEIGTVQDVPALAAVARERSRAVVHVDAVAALGRVPVDFQAWAVDAASVAAHKIGSTGGCGALLLRRDVALTPLLHGGGQERRLRSGTVDVPAAAAFGAACVAMTAELTAQTERLRELRDRLGAGLRALPGVRLMGDPSRRLPDNVHALFDGCDGDSLLFLLDQAGYQVSTGSACTAGVPQPSAVLRAVGVPEAEARGALRFTLGRDTTRTDIDGLLAVLPGALERARRAGHSDRRPALGGAAADA